MVWVMSARTTTNVWWNDRILSRRLFTFEWTNLNSEIDLNRNDFHLMNHFRLTAHGYETHISMISATTTTAYRSSNTIRLNSLGAASFLQTFFANSAYFNQLKASSPLPRERKKIMEMSPHQLINYYSNRIYNHAAFKWMWLRSIYAMNLRWFETGRWWTRSCKCTPATGKPFLLMRPIRICTVAEHHSKMLMAISCVQRLCINSTYTHTPNQIRKSNSRASIP